MARTAADAKVGWSGLVLSVALNATGAAQAQTAAAPAAAPAAATDDSLTFHGITLYGIVDVGIQNQTHGAPISDYFVAGSADIVQKNSNHSVTGVTPSNLSNSRIGLQGVEPLVGDWSGVFRLETFFNPQSGQISDALKSLVQNNGRSLATQNTNIDSSASGQTFIQSYAGFSSKTFGTFTFGRQNTVLADGVAKYDPNFASQAFSLIGLSGTAAGGGDTQNRRLDSSMKYVGSFNVMERASAHLSAQYKFNQSTGSANTAYEVAIGGDYAGRIGRCVLRQDQGCGCGRRAQRGPGRRLTGLVPQPASCRRQLRRGEPEQRTGRNDLGQHHLRHLRPV